MGDLGKHFPDTDPAWKGVSSLIILEAVYQKMDQAGYKIGNVDSLIMIEKPKMAPHIAAMTENVAKALHCECSQISVKATRGEKLGFVGEKKGVQAQAVVLLMKKEG